MMKKLRVREETICQRKRKDFFRRLREGLTKTRNNIVAGIDSIFSGFSSIDDDFYEEIEEILVMGGYWYQYHNIYY